MHIIYVIFFIFPLFIQAEGPKICPTICLNMIVKNESKVIERCLSSVLPIIDRFVIVDTGSTDGTQQIIKDFMNKNGIPGELYERPWVNFGHNRNEALEKAQGKADYTFFIDADEYLVYEPDFKLPVVDKDFYYVITSHSGSKYSRIQLINNQLDWKWVGVLHEVISCAKTKNNDTLEKVVNIYTTEGARSQDPEKYQKDAQILEAALKENPNDSRNVFYLAQSYSNAGNYPLALENYKKRAEMKGWDQEVFWSLYQIAVMQELLKEPQDVILRCYNRAYQARRSRIEPLYQMARLFRDKEDFHSSYKVAKIAETLPVTQDLLFVQQWMYDYGIPLELSISAYWIGKYEECQRICLDLLKRNDLPQNVRTCVEDNLGFANAKLLEQVCSELIQTIHSTQ